MRPLTGLCPMPPQKPAAGFLPPSMNEAERNHLRSDLTSAQLDVARLHAALSDDGDPVAEFHPPAGAPSRLVAMQRRFLMSQTAELGAKLAALDPLADMPASTLRAIRSQKVVGCNP